MSPASPLPPEQERIFIEAASDLLARALGVAHADIDYEPLLSHRGVRVYQLKPRTNWTRFTLPEEPLIGSPAEVATRFAELLRPGVECWLAETLAETLE